MSYIYVSYKPSNTVLMGLLDTSMYMLRMSTVGNVVNTCIFPLTQPYCSVMRGGGEEAHKIEAAVLSG